MGWRAVSVGVMSTLLLGVYGGNTPARGDDGTRFAMTHSRSEYAHWIELYDASGSRIDPEDPEAPPYSPLETCGRCHDYEAISHGYHFNAMEKMSTAGRPGEPWIWTDSRTGTQIPLSYRGWPGTYDPRKLGISAWDMVLKFGRQMPGGGPGAPPDTEPAEETDVTSARDVEQGREQDDVSKLAEPVDNGRWHLSGELAIDCMMCHGKDGAYSRERWWEQVSKQNFAWAPSAALGIANIDGDVSRLRDVKPAPQPKGDSGDGNGGDGNGGDGNGGASDTERPGPRLPKTSYHPVRMDTDQKVFFDVVLKPSNNACYYCHTTRMVGDGVTPDWTHDEDVHVQAGMLCADCHRNGIEHHTVRGYEGEEHPTGEEVATLSCRGCHLGEQTEAERILGGRFAAPKAIHKGLPPLHLEDMSCTSCHSGPPPRPRAIQVQTAMAHGLGLPTHHMGPSVQPQMVAPVMLRTGEKDEVLYPHRMVWPAFWGKLEGETVTPLNPEKAHDLLRRTLRVRRNSTFTETLSEVRLSSDQKAEVLGEERAKVPAFQLTEEEKEKLETFKESQEAVTFRKNLGEALVELKNTMEGQNADPVYVAGGQAYRLADTAASKAESEKGEGSSEDAEIELEVFRAGAAEPYAWKLAHDVRPARWSTGSVSCFECHDFGAPIYDGKVTAMGPAIDPDPPTHTMLELAGYDRTLTDAWNLSFQVRTAFKWFGFAAVTVVTVILLSFTFFGVNATLGLFRRR